MKRFSFAGCPRPGRLRRRDNPPARREGRRRASGVSVLEILLSVSVLGLSVGALLTGFSSVLRTQSKVEDYVRARHLAASQLANLRLGDVAALSVESELGERFPDPFSEYRWKARVSPSRANPRLLLVYLSVSRSAGDRSEGSPLFSVHTLLVAR